MSIKRGQIFLAFALVLFLPFCSWAQGGATGAITGVVQDAQGGVIPNATVVVTSKATGLQVRQVTTSSGGTFSVQLLPPGAYKVEITAPGFAKFEIDNMTVRVTETSNITANMKVGAITETITVSEAAMVVQTTSAATGQVVTSATVSTLPLSTRNFLVLTSLSAGANTELFDSTALGRGAITLNANGQRPVNNNYVLEGIQVNDVNLPIYDNVPLPNPQTIQEFKTQLSLYDASNGRNGGASISATLKSGGSQYHGDIYEFFRNDVLNANDWFNNANGVGRPTLRQNQFGASIGGPIPNGGISWLKNFFMYGNYQGTRAASGAAPGTFLSATMVALPSSRSAANLMATFFPDGLPPGYVQLDPVAVAFLNLPGSNCPELAAGDPFCIPSLGTPGVTRNAAGIVNGFSLGRVVRTATGAYDEDQYTITADKEITAKDKLSVRYFNDIFEITRPFGGGSSLAFLRSLPQTNRFVKVSWLRTLSSRMVNEARFGFNRFSFAQVPDEPVLLTDIGATRGNSAQFPAAYRITIGGSGGFALGTAVNDDRGGAFNTFEWSDDFSISLGKHTLRAGFVITRYQLNRYNNFATRGSVTFANGAAADGTTGCAPPQPCLADLRGFQNFLLGRITGTQGRAGFSTFYFRAQDYGVYLQDDWKWSPRLTLNMGLRWEAMSTAHEKFGYLSNYLGLGDGTPGPIRIIHPQETARVGTPGVKSCTLLDCLDANNYGPRVGFAYDLLGNQKVVIRSGYGVYFQRVSNQALLQTSGGLPFAEDFSAARFSVTTANPFPAIRPNSDFPLPNDEVIPRLISFNAATGAPIFESASGGPVSGFKFYPQRNFRAPMAQQWNLQVQYEFWKKWVWEVGYVGTKGSALIGTGRSFNPSQVCTLVAPCIIPASIGANVTVPAGTPNVVKNPDGTVSITGSTFANRDARVPVAYIGLANNRGFFQGQDGNSNYHSLQTSVIHQWSNGLYFQAAYTYSKSIDNSSGSAFGDELNGLLHFGSLLDQRTNRAVSDFDRTHRFVVSYNYDIPFGKWFGIPDQGWGRLVNGWAINGVTTAQSGNPVTIYDSGAVTLEDMEQNNALFRAHLPAGVTLSQILTTGKIQDRVAQYFNLNLFTNGGTCVNSQNVAVACTDPTAVAAAQGSLGRNTFRGPFQQNWDMSFTKHTKINERWSADFRAELFNVWNHPSFAPPQAGGPGTATGNLGVVDVSAGDSSILATANRPRIIQFALKINF